MVYGLQWVKLTVWPVVTLGAILSTKDKILFGGNNGLSVFEKNDSQFTLKFDKVLTPRSEIPFRASMSSLSGIINDRFFMTKCENTISKCPF